MLNLFITAKHLLEIMSRNSSPEATKRGLDLLATAVNDYEKNLAISEEVDISEKTTGGELR